MNMFALFHLIYVGDKIHVPQSHRILDSFVVVLVVV